MPPLLEDAQAQLSRRFNQLDDEAHGMRIVSAQLKRKADPFLVVFAVMFVWEAHEVVCGSAGQAHVIAILASGLVAEGVAALSPMLSLREKIKKYYKLEWKSICHEVEMSLQVNRHDWAS